MLGGCPALERASAFRAGPLPPSPPAGKNGGLCIDNEAGQAAEALELTCPRNLVAWLAPVALLTPPSAAAMIRPPEKPSAVWLPAAGRTPCDAGLFFFGDHPCDDDRRRDLRPV